MTTALKVSAALTLAACIAYAQLSPGRQTSATINGKTVSIRYGAPSVRGRQIFGPGGLLSRDPTYPAWRAGANLATLLHTDADLNINGLEVPAGDYSIYVWVENPDQWQLILNKQTGQIGLIYNADRDLGRVPMNMSKPPSLIETYKMTLSSEGGNRGKLQLEWENHIASVPFTVK